MIDFSSPILIEDFIAIEQYQDVKKDILVVVHNNLHLTEKFLESLYDNTENFHVYIWDNNSEDGTLDYLERLCEIYSNISIVPSQKNEYFIKPNNELIKLGTSPYVILLNNDTICYPQWYKVLISRLQRDHECGATGYLGGLVDQKGRGLACCYGYNIDYIQGWCLAIRRVTYDEYGLFDENLVNAYCEDSDFCFKLRSKGYYLYASYLRLVTHEKQSSTSNQKISELNYSFQKNHNILAKKWASFLATNRAILTYSKEDLKEIARLNHVNESILLFDAKRVL